MSDTTYTVIFSGQLVEGADAEAVKANFARLFKVELARVEPMFSGKPAIIKKGVDEATANKYQQALRQAGALCELVPSQPAAAQAPVPPAAPAATGAQPTPASSETVSPSTLPAPATPTEAAPDVSTLNATIAEPGVVLIEPEQVETPQIETSHLSMDEVGVTLVEAEAVPDLQVDISTLTMAEPGVVLKEPEEVEVPNIDTSGMSLGA